MKKLLLFIICFWSVLSFAQSKVFIRGDSIYVLKVGGDATLIVENATRTVTGGVLTNIGNGRTAFVTPSPGTTIGSTVINGTPTSNLFIGSNGLLQQSPTKWNFDSANVRVGINLTTPLSRLHLQTNAIGLSQSDANGILLENSTIMASISDSQSSVPITYSVYGWKTFGSASQKVTFRTEAVSTVGAVSTEALWKLRASENGGAYATIFAINSSGTIQHDLYGRWGRLGGNVYQNIYLGLNAMLSIANAAVDDAGDENNTAIGNNALRNNDTSWNTAVGFNSMQATTTGQMNAAFGANALLVNTTGQKNFAGGAGAMEQNTTGSFNTAGGMDSKLNNTSGSHNTSFGYLSGSSNTTGDGNVSLGSSAGRGPVGGNYNINIGFSSAYLDWGGVNQQLQTARNSIAIGAFSYNTANNQTYIGNDSTNQLILKGITYNTPASAMMLVKDTLTNIIYHQAIPSGGGSGVSSITGTANQITASAATGAVTLSIPSVFSAPGTITAATGLTVTTGGATITAGGLTVTAGGALITAGGLTVTAGATTLTPLNTIGLVFNSAAGVLSSYAATDHGLQIGNAVGQIASLGLGTTGQVLTSNGAGSDPSWQAGMTNPMTTTGDMIYSSSGTTPDRLAAVAVGSYLRSNGTSTAPLWSTLKLPNTATVNYVPIATATNTLGEDAGLQFNPTTNDLIIEGTAASVADGPTLILKHIGDAHALIAYLGYGHNNIQMSYDAYPNTSNWTSSSGTSNFSIAKVSDEFILGYNTGTAAGSTFSGFNLTGGLRMANNGSIGIGVAASGLGKFNSLSTSLAQLVALYDASNYFTTTVGSTGSATLNLVGTTPEFTFSDAVNVPDDAYAAGWNGNTEAPTKNAVYDKIQAVTVPISSLTAAAGTNTIDNGNVQQEWQWNSLTGLAGRGLYLSTNSSAVTGLGNLFRVEMSGANPDASVTNTSAFFVNGRTGTTSTNIAGHFQATGGTNNYGIIVQGRAGFENSTPTSSVHTTSFASGIRGITALRTLDETDHTIEVTANTFTVTLPISTSCIGREYTITNSGAGVTTVATTSSETFRNVTATPTTLTLNQFNTVTIKAVNGAWLRTSSL